MILYPPVKFDANECFIFLAIAANLLLIFLLPRRFSLLTLTGIWLFNIFLAQSTDFIIGKPPLELYRFNDLKEYEYFDVLLYLLVYPPVAYFFLYFYDHRRWTGNRLRFYLIASAFITSVLERLAVQFHVFTYIHWNLLYSYLVYLLVFALNIRLLNFLRRFLPVNRNYSPK
ncbi:Hypothetical protein LUCI_1997 [Lucifera butyrica]|uniref:Uncharacterized protein n=1 Tax=Lucifera butyrica TaxID=1351585 RepID=A0A498R5U0_9FIRM|nr:hypothetical protein [Lucifera butyrica]VBB06761.1 Hypothetical protein LUCI_1997 [Lucifera butyrica]